MFNDDGIIITSKIELLNSSSMSFLVYVNY